VALGVLCIGLGFGLMPVGRTWLFAALTVGVWSAGEILSMPLFGAIVAGRAAPESQGRYMGLASFAFNLAFIAGPAAGTAVYRGLGPTTLWLGCGLLGLLVAAGFLLFHRRSARIPG
jgi:predicted MFS family arabinose efflux permease